MEGKLNLRRMLLEEICCDIAPSSSLNLKGGLPGLYLLTCAKNGDPTAFDLLTAVGMDLNMARPKAQGGKDANAARDFLLSYLSKVLMLKYPELSHGATMLRAKVSQLSISCAKHSKMLVLGVSIIVQKSKTAQYHEAQSVL